MKFENKYIVKIQNDFDTDSTLILDRLKVALQKRTFITEALKNRINFKWLIKQTTHEGANKLALFRTFREGKIILSQQSSDEIEISSEVSLRHLISIAILTGFAFGLPAFFFYAQGEVLPSFLFGAVPMVLVLFLGYKNINDGMKSIVKESIRI